MGFITTTCRYGVSRYLFQLYKHYKKLTEILLQCHQYFLPFFQVIILDIMMSCDFKNFHIFLPLSTLYYQLLEADLSILSSPPVYKLRAANVYKQSRTSCSC